MKTRTRQFLFKEGSPNHFWIAFKILILLYFSRPPWFGKSGTLRQEPFIIGISGGSASGKTTVATNIIKQLDVQWVTLISMDAFYRVLNEEQHEAATRNDYNFDHPDAFDFPLLLDTLKRLKEYKEVKVPIYNFVTHRREVIL